MSERTFDPLGRLAAMGIILGEPGPTAGSYVASVRSGDLLFISGQIPRDDEGEVMTGAVSVEVSVAEARRRARRVGVEILKVAHHALGGLDRVARLVKLNGYVRAPEGFTAHPQVVDGCSDLMGKVLGSRGIHARAAVGTASLPLGATVEIEAVFEVDSESAA